MELVELIKRLKSIYVWIPSHTTAKAKMAELIKALGGKVEG